MPPDNILFWLFHRHLGMGPAVGVVILDAQLNFSQGQLLLKPLGLIPGGGAQLPRQVLRLIPELLELPVHSVGIGDGGLRFAFLGFLFLGRLFLSRTPPPIPQQPRSFPG